MNIWSARIDRLAAALEVGGDSRNRPMEGLRGVAVVLVFVAHYHALFSGWLRPGSSTHALSSFVANLGHTGVDLFFVISGYLIYGAVIRKRVGYASFMRRRVERIYPTFTVIFAAYVALSLAFPAYSRIPADPAVAAGYLLQNFLLLPGIFSVEPMITVAWSLSYEIFFYLALPAMVAGLAMRRWPRRARVGFLLVATGVYVGYCLIGPHSRIRLIMFASGMLLYETIQWYGRDRPLPRRADVLAVLLLLASLPLVYLLYENVEMLGMVPFGARGGKQWRIVVLALAFFVFAGASFNSAHFLSRWTSWTPLRLMGNVSYSWYLIHGLTLRAVAEALAAVATPRPLPVAYLLAAPVLFGLTLVTSVVLYLAVEKPLSIDPALSAARTARARRVPVLALASAEGAAAASPAPSEASSD